MCDIGTGKAILGSFRLPKNALVFFHTPQRESFARLPTWKEESLKK